MSVQTDIEETIEGCTKALEPGKILVTLKNKLKIRQTEKLPGREINTPLLGHI